MWSCKTILQRHLSPRGSQDRGLCCRAAPARSPVTSYTEAGARTQPGVQGIRQSHDDHAAQHQSQQLLCQAEHLVQVADAALRLTGDATSSGAAGGVSLLEEDTVTDHQAAAVLLPPPPTSSDAPTPDISFFQPGEQSVALPLLQLPDQGQRQHPRHHRHQQHQHRHQHQLWHTSPQLAAYEGPLNGGTATDGEHSQHDRRRTQPARSSPSNYGGIDQHAGCYSQTPLATSSTHTAPYDLGLGPRVVQMAPAAAAAVLEPRALPPQNTLTAAASTFDKRVATSIEETLPYLDAVSRSTGETSTSERRGSTGPGATVRSGGGSRRRSMAEGSQVGWRGATSRKQQGAAVSGLATPNADGDGEGEGEGGLLTGTGNRGLGNDCNPSGEVVSSRGSSSSTSSSSEKNMSSSSNLDSTDGLRIFTFDSGGTTSSSSRNSSGRTGAAWSPEGRSVDAWSGNGGSGQIGARCGGPSSPLHSAPTRPSWSGALEALPQGHPEADEPTPTALSLPPEGEAYSVAAAVPLSGSARTGAVRQQAAGADRRKSAAIPANAPIGWRRPRAPTPKEHLQLRRQAELQQQALLPRDPTVEDLRLTTRVMSAVHWRDLLAILTEYRAACERRAPVQDRGQGQGQDEARCWSPATDLVGPAQAAHDPDSADPRTQLRGLAVEQPSQQQEQQHQAPNPRLHVSHHASVLPPAGYGQLGGASSQTQSSAGATGGPPAPESAPAGQFGPATSLVPVSELPYTPQHVAAILLRMWQLLMHSDRGPASRSEARQLRSLVEGMVRMAGVMLDSPGMGMREIIVIFYALVRLQHPVRRPFYIALMNAARRRFKTRPAPAPSAPPSNSKGRGRSGKRAEVAAEVAAGGASPAVSSPLPYNAQDMAMLLWSVSACGMEGVRADWAGEYGKALERVVPDLTAQGVSVVLYGMARLRSPPRPELLAALCSRLLDLLLQQSASQVEPYGTCGAVAADAAVRQSNPAAWPSVLEADLDQGRPALDVDAAAPVIHVGCASREPCAAADAATGEHCRLQPSGSRPATATASVMDLPQYGHPPPPPLPQQPDRGCRPADLSMSLWALATLRLPPSSVCPALLPAAERYSLRRLPDFPQQELSNLVWAMARLQYTPGSAWIQGLYGSVASLLDELQPQALAMLLYSLAQMGQRPEDGWLGAVARRVQEQLRGFTPQALALTVHALASMGYRPEAAWLEDFHSQLESHSGQLDTRVRDKVREAYRTLGFRPSGSLRRMGPETAGQATAAAASTRSGSGSANAGSGRAETLATRWSSGAQPTGTSQREQQQEPRQGQAQEPAHGQRLGSQSQGRSRRHGAEATGGASSVESGAGAAEEVDIQVLVRPSRFVF